MCPYRVLLWFCNRVKSILSECGLPPSEVRSDINKECIPLCFLAHGFLGLEDCGGASSSSLSESPAFNDDRRVRNGGTPSSKSAEAEQAITFDGMGMPAEGCGDEAVEAVVSPFFLLFLGGVVVGAEA